MEKPNVGQIVQYFAKGDHSPNAGVVIAELAEGKCNLAVFTENTAEISPITAVEFNNDGEIGKDVFCRSVPNPDSKSGRNPKS